MNDERRDDPVTELLDRALHHRRARAPRPGLEQRVLAHVRAAPARRHLTGWMPALAVAAMLGIAGVWLFVTWRPDRGNTEIASADVPHAESSTAERAVPTEQVHTTSDVSPAERPEAVEVADASVGGRREPPVPAPAGHPSAAAAATVAEDARAGTDPAASVAAESVLVASRPAVFPSQRSLSGQEQLLVRFLQTVPRETLSSLAREPSPTPLRVEKLSTPRIRIEPLLDVPRT